MFILDRIYEIFAVVMSNENTEIKKVLDLIGVKLKGNFDHLNDKSILQLAFLSRFSHTSSLVDLF